jgi:hypothetical protein
LSFVAWHSRCSREAHMTLRSRSRKILIPDVPPSAQSINQGLVIAGIGVFCATLVIAAVLFVFFGA